MEHNLSHARIQGWNAAAAVLVAVAATAAVVATVASAAVAVAGDVAIAYRMDSPRLRFAAARLESSLRARGDAIAYRDIGRRPERIDIAIAAGESDRQALARAGFDVEIDAAIRNEGFRILRRERDGREVVLVLAREDTGAMYGGLELAEEIRAGRDLAGVEERLSVPRFPFRAIKFNLPWSPYRGGPATAIHLGICRDLGFWERFLDAMAENRFNVLSLWNLHPFPYLIRPKDFPEACPLSDGELSSWRSFWRGLFRRARDRGIETYLVNWNIVVSPEFARAHGVKERNDTSEIVRRYTRECVTQVIDEYPDLTGLGVTLADWMQGMTPRQREDWIEETFIAGMKRASRPVKFIHRSVLAGSPIEMRRVIDDAALPDPVWVEVKFNWSHGHSTPRLAITHDYPTGEIDDRFWNPPPQNYRIAWMVRNEDFFILRWGDADFIRRHIATNGKPYVGGYFVGSEGYIPASDSSHRARAHKTWQYAFEKQWLFYRLWGRLLYDPETSDAVLARGFRERYPGAPAGRLLDAWARASRMPLRLASFHAATWDYTLYSEGFLAPATSRGTSDGVSPFISIDELIDHQVLDPAYLSIPDFVKGSVAGEPAPAGLVTPLDLAGASEADSRAVLEAVADLRRYVTPFSGALECELDDLDAWARLGLYFAHKLRAGVALERFRLGAAAGGKEEAIAELQEAAAEWKRLAEVTASHYVEIPHVSGAPLSWARYLDQVERDVQIARDSRR